MNTTVKALVITAVLMVAFWPKKADAQPSPAPFVPPLDDTLNVSYLSIPNYDALWDYKYQVGTWYTKRKTSTIWLVMREHLSAENYKLAVSRLIAFARDNKLIT